MNYVDFLKRISFGDSKLIGVLTDNKGNLITLYLDTFDGLFAYLLTNIYHKEIKKEEIKEEKILKKDGYYVKQLYGDYIFLYGINYDIIGD